MATVIAVTPDLAILKSLCFTRSVTLRDELSRLDAEIKDKTESYEDLLMKLRDVEIEKTLMQVELVGLRERRRALAAAMPAEVPGSGRPVAASTAAIDIAKLTLVDAIASVITAAAAPMQISEVCDALARGGRKDNPNSVSVTLNYLAHGGKIQRVARGVYAPHTVDESGSAPYGETVR